jgi:lipopolysaccharide/colanic/teichoic acid biosynthesis glycosyltransferase
MAWFALSPFMVLVCLLIVLTDKEPAFFFHERIGLHFLPFRLIKFRSMKGSKNFGCGAYTPGDNSRVTPIGGWIRKFKIDELPGLMNILRGEMSIVGPRPEVKKYVDLFPSVYGRLLQIRPGLSDFAALKYRHEERILASQTDPDCYYRSAILPDKIALYVRYAETISIRTDLMIIIATVKAIICPRRG